MNIKWRGFSEGEKILIFNRFRKLGFQDDEIIKVWEKVSGLKISKNFLKECFELYDEIPEIVEYLHQGKINLTLAKEVLKFPEDLRKPILSFLGRIKGSCGDFLRFLRLLEDGYYSGMVREISFIEKFSELKSASEEIFKLSHPRTSKCMDEIEKVIIELPPGFTLKLPEFLSGNNVELKITFNILDGLKIPENFEEVISKIRRIVVEGVDI